MYQPASLLFMMQWMGMNRAVFNQVHLECGLIHVSAPDGSGEDASRVPLYGELEAQVMAYILKLEAGWYAITNPVRKTGFALHFDQFLYPYIWYWQQLSDVAQGYSWSGRTHCATLAPCTS